MAYNGNLIDLSFVSTILALSKIKLSFVRVAGFEESERVEILSEEIKPFKRFPLHHMPIAITFYFVKGEILIDPTVFFLCIYSLI